jgi:hypothetical protein
VLPAAPSAWLSFTVMVSAADRQAARPPAGPDAGEVAAPVVVAGGALDGGALAAGADVLLLGEPHAATIPAAATAAASRRTAGNEGTMACSLR